MYYLKPLIPFPHRHLFDVDRIDLHNPKNMKIANLVSMARDLDRDCPNVDATPIWWVISRQIKFMRD